MKRTHGITVQVCLTGLTLALAWLVGAVLYSAAEPPGTINSAGEEVGVTFTQAFYCAVITSLSIGYGDFSPSTVLSRAFAVAAIFAGVTFFSYLSVRMLALLEKSFWWIRRSSMRERTGGERKIISGRSV